METIIFAKKLLKLYEKDLDLAEYLEILVDKFYSDKESIKGE